MYQTRRQVKDNMGEKITEIEREILNSYIQNINQSFYLTTHNFRPGFYLRPGPYLHYFTLAYKQGQNQPSI